MNEEEKDLEEELKEEKDRYERQNQEAYDMEIENEIKRKRQAEKGFLDEGSTFRTLTGLGVEIGGNFILDLASAIPGSQQAGSAFLNYLQQKIRGGKVSKGEILAAAAASQIPFLQQSKALTKGGRFLRSVGKGSTAGAIDASARSIIDEKELPTFEEFATGVTAGGAFGGAFDLAPSAFKGKLGQELNEIGDDAANYIEFLQNRLGGDLAPFNFEGTDLLSGTVSAAKLTKLSPKRQQQIQDFLSGKTTQIDRVLSGLIQDPNFTDADFTRDIGGLMQKVRRDYPNIDVDTRYQRFKWQWHHINPINFPTDFYVGLGPNSRNYLTTTLKKATKISAGNNPSNRIGLATETHDEITRWLDTEIGRRAKYIKQKISDDFGYGLDLTKRKDNLLFNQLFAAERVQKRVPYVLEYGKLVNESSVILQDLINQFDVFYKVPTGYTFEIDVNDMINILDDIPLDGSRPTIKTLQEVMADVLQDKKINAYNPATGREVILQPAERMETTIRRIDIEGQLNDAYNKNSTLKQSEIRSLVKELKEITQMSLDFKPGNWKRYLEQYMQKRYGGTRKTGKK
tara:strand:- start:44 stop:1756 length:1713 start_codon:yes stop_codon:yes gene_type:complete